MIWEKTEIDSQLVRELSKKTGLDLLPSSILARRNIVDRDQLCFFLENDIRFLHNPFLFNDMENAIERLGAAIDEGEKVLIFGDRDVDGITSIVLLFELLKEMGLEVEWSLPSGNDSYGLTQDVIQGARDRDITLLITVDCGISNVREVAYAGELGIDTIIIDHHNPHEELPRAAAIINPKVESSGYPFKNLSGCAVVSKLAWALYFSKTRYYGEPIFLFNIRPVNESYILEAIKLTNLMETERMSDTVIPGKVAFTQTRLSSFFSDKNVAAYNLPEIEHQLKKVFGTLPDISLTDMMPILGDTFPALKGKSLLKIRDLSKVARYSVKPLEEIDILSNLVISYIMKTESRLTRDYSEKLDLVALGTLADIMPLTDENRILVKMGMEVIRNGKRNGLKDLLARRELLNREINAKDISWYITPVINASGRMGEPERAIEMFLTHDKPETDRLVSYILELNEKRKSLGEKVWNDILPQAQESFNRTENKFVLISGNSIHRGITGIIASRLVKYFKVPSIVLAQLDGKAVGSMRSLPPLNTKEFLYLFKDIFNDFGGHDLAGGFTLDPERIGEFTDRFSETVASLKKDEIEEDKVIIDAEIPPAYLTQDLWKVVELFKPYGEGNPPLVFYTKNIKIADMKLIGKKDLSHLSLLFDTGTLKWPAVFWNSSQRAGTDFNVNDKVEIVYNLTKNHFQKVESLRLTVIDVKKLP
ncbi:MAG: single-stranded-DNA-specific exonuclease RecJ [Spirochaetales bacterium]|nr:single-stranded-DNA-specific exonuclease RecJ [Spirochaetales bacterium]